MRSSGRGPGTGPLAFVGGSRLAEHEALPAPGHHLLQPGASLVNPREKLAASFWRRSYCEVLAIHLLTHRGGGKQSRGGEERRGLVPFHLVNPRGIAVQFLVSSKMPCPGRVLTERGGLVTFPVSPTPTEGGASINNCLVLAITSQK